MPARKKPSRKTGRPAEVDRDAILDAAEKVFADRGFDAATTRELARKAKCNLALISYHFGGKEGLYQAVLIRHFARIRARYAEIDLSESTLRSEWPELKDQAQRRFCASLHQIMKIKATTPHMGKVICREMMAGAAKMAAAMSRSESGVYLILRETLEQLQEEGKLSRELDLKFGIVSLIGPLIYSDIARPLLKGVYGVEEIDERYWRGLCLHLTRALFEGWGLPAKI